MKKTDSHETERILVDSWGWIEYFAEGEKAEEYSRYIENASPDRYSTSTIILYEVYKRIRSLYSEELAMRAVAHIKYTTKVIDLTDHIAIAAAEISLKENIPMADAVILATAEHAEATLVTSDPHFEGMDDVKFV